ncbi:MAG: hypothetical protein CVU84_12785 [Firmicutes bacterium HGW-Firmicutes-1]|nr:MAG: hypothetical protein CVU84_12785 [Firmicutes bacterium HGW-Firmicutes-1]
MIFSPLIFSFFPYILSIEKDNNQKFLNKAIIPIHENIFIFLQKTINPSMSHILLNLLFFITKLDINLFKSIIKV